MSTGNTEGKGSSGARFKIPPAAIWNNMVDAGRAWADDRLSSQGGTPIRPRATDIIKIQNTSGDARRTGEILKIEGKALDTIVAEHIWLLGIAPTADCYFGILKKPAEDDGVEDLQVSGCCMALVDIGDEDHTRADVESGEYVLKSSDSGPIEILYAPTGTGEKECVVRFAGGGSTDIMHGIVHASLGCGYYEVEIATWNGVSPSGSGSGSNSGTDGCDICEAIGATTSGSASISDCEEEAELPVFEESEASDHIVERQTTGTGVIVLAFHAGSRFVPLAQWSDCLMVDLGDENDTVSGSDSDSSVATEPVYQILSGHQEHVIQYKEEWGCCNGTWQIISRTPIIFAAKVCAEEACADCD